MFIAIENIIEAAYINERGAASQRTHILDRFFHYLLQHN